MPPRVRGSATDLRSRSFHPWREDDMIECRVVAEPIDVAGLMSGAGDESAGAIASFVGVARRSSSARRDGLVERMEYEAYIPMAEREMSAIAGEAVEQFGVINLLVHHRIGRLEIGD